MSVSPDPTLVDRIVSVLAAEIETGELSAGSRLLQNDLASRFSASHVPVREAFRRLEAMGLVQSLPRRGARVAAVDAQLYFEAIEMRAVLESLALVHARAHYAPGHLAKIAEADLVCNSAMTAGDWEKANRNFHQLLIDPCPMPGLLAEIGRLHSVLRRGVAHLGGRQTLSFPREDRDHKIILSSLREAQIDRAAGILASHIRKGHLRKIL
ncbi:GntR family transcriptional regulator [Tabrizicola sp.]|jgi:DNA-binding GntR family transcriptional regulator|uniref:GntR family transcriptional regulator n=1 Tax=Tabrizicola sp. TaxID=2005166 RepID=UPI0027332FEA|nr:GntR family transcriptional regulator [Tabrizicola sp.]MDP3197679.1 GntR family transcriptional regulator [Tabrizicola sp.]